MNDARNYFTAQTGDAIGANTFHLGTNVLDIAQWDEPGRGTPKFINVWGASFTSDADVASVHLLTSTAADPAITDEIMTVITLAALSGDNFNGLIAKVPLPSKGLAKYLNIGFEAETVITTGAYITAFLTID